MLLKKKNQIPEQAENHGSWSTLALKTHYFSFDFSMQSEPSSTDFVVAFPSKVKIPNSKTQATGIRFDGILWD